MADIAALLVDEVFAEQPVRQWVLSFPYPLLFLFASRPEVMGRVLGIVYRGIATYLIKKAGFSRKAAQAGSVRFRWVRTPTSTELAGLTQTLAQCVGRFLECQGSLERDAENSYLAGDVLESGPMKQLLGSSMMCMDARMSRAQDAQERPTTESRSGRCRVATCSCYRSCRHVRSRSMPESTRWRSSSCTPVWRRGRINARS